MKEAIEDYLTILPNQHWFCWGMEDIETYNLDYIQMLLDLPGHWYTATPRKIIARIVHDTGPTQCIRCKTMYPSKAFFYKRGRQSNNVKSYMAHCKYCDNAYSAITRRTRRAKKGTG